MTKHYTVLIFLALFFAGVAELVAQPGNYWTTIDERMISGESVRRIVPLRYRTLSLETLQTKELLASAPNERSASSTVIYLPMPNGQDIPFTVFYAPILAPELAAEYPEIRTYSVFSAGRYAASGKIDMTPNGFHGMIFTPDGMVFIDPYRVGDNTHYISYYKKDFVKTVTTPINGNCVVDDPEIREYIRQLTLNPKVMNPNNQLRTYRLALAGTGEYTAFHGGTATSGLAAMTTTMNRVNGVYEKDLAIRMVLVANNNLLVYTNASTDPYSNNNGSTMLGQNQTTCDNIIGSANYDIGHVFSTGGGGIAGLGVICRAGQKAQGVTGGPSPVGDPFDIDYVAHEMGHQFGANHTFNSQTSSCGGGNRNSSTAFEPGSGTTVMAYAGICGSDDLQPNSDAYFHLASLVEITAYTSTGTGNSCAVITTTTNTAPVVTVPTGGFTIPFNTPFALTGSATDAENDQIFYCWEQYDLGPAGTAINPTGNAPMFRSFNPTLSPTRTFPRLANLLNNTTTIGEKLPNYARSMLFRLTARDNKVGGGLYSIGQVQFNVVSTAGPFAVTFPNTAVSIPALSVQTVTWSVANTDAAPVSVAAVKILLSTDGGNTWPTVLAVSTANDGSENVIIPDVRSTTARIRVEAIGNIFFDISNANFTVDQPVPVELTGFIATPVTFGVSLHWRTATETNNKGFSIERSSGVSGFTEIGYVAGKGTTVEVSEYQFTDRKAGQGNVTYRLKQIDFDGTVNYSPTIDVNVPAPEGYSLGQNFPNPFNPSTSISYSIAREGFTTLSLFNTMGEKIMTLVSEYQQAGNYETTVDLKNLSTGIYYYRLESNGFSQMKKMSLIK